MFIRFSLGSLMILNVVVYQRIIEPIPMIGCTFSLNGRFIRGHIYFRSRFVVPGLMNLHFNLGEVNIRDGSVVVIEDANNFLEYWTLGLDINKVNEDKLRDIL